MKEQIQQLIANGQTKDALHLLVQMNSGNVNLQAQYNNGEKQFNLGLIEFSEWQRIQARVNFKILELLEVQNLEFTPKYMSVRNIDIPEADIFYVAISYDQFGEVTFSCSPDKSSAFLISNEFVWNCSKSFFESLEYSIGYEV